VSGARGLARSSLEVRRSDRGGFYLVYRLGHTRGGKVTFWEDRTLACWVASSAEVGRRAGIGRWGSSIGRSKTGLCGGPSWGKVWSCQDEVLYSWLEKGGEQEMKH